MFSRKLEIGPSPARRQRPGWDTLDSQPGCTVQALWGYDPLPLENDSYSHVFSSHVLEHIPWFHTASALADVHRILCANGTFEVWVPDFQKIVARFNEGTITNDGWLPLNPERDAWKSLNGRLFWGARTGEVGKEQHFHRACFDQTSLSRLLSRAGFRSIELITDRPGGHGWVDLGLIGRKL